MPAGAPPKIDESHFLYPGTLLAKGGETAISTILGSCVSVCLWDPVLGVGGMNHYLLPLWNGDGLQTPRYGNVAIPMLIERMLDLGSSRAGLVAKVFGGASIFENLTGLLNVGERNIVLADEVLQEEGIPIVGRDTGGALGRKIMFVTSSGAVFVKKVKGSSYGQKD